MILIRSTKSYSCRYTVLSHPKCVTPVRQTSLSRLGFQCCSGTDHCCGSEMFIPYPNFFHPGSRIPDPQGQKDSRIRIRIKEFLGNMIQSSSRIRILIFNPSRIPDPGSERPLIPDRSVTMVLITSSRLNLSRRQSISPPQR